MMNQVDASPGRESQIITLQRRPSTGTLHDGNEERSQFKRKQPQLVAPPKEPLYCYDFFDRSPAIRTARKAYLVNMFKGVFLVSIWIFGVFSIYWGSLWKVPDGRVTGFIVIVPATEYPGGIPQVIHDVVEQKAWFAVTIAPGITSQLNASLDIPNPSYNASTAVMVFGNEGRNELTYRNLLRSNLFPALLGISNGFAAQNAKAHAGNLNLASILAISPQTIVDPVGFGITTVRAFTPPVASAPMFVGLIYLTVLAFAIVSMSFNLREGTGLNKMLNFRSLMLLRLLSNIIIYFYLSLIALFRLTSEPSMRSLTGHDKELTLLTVLGALGFVIFWMLSWAGMMALGLALESVIVILTPRFMPFFLLLWVIVNVAAAQWPPVLLPSIFRYGYASPFYSISMGSRAIIFGIKNNLGLNFGILIIWIVISCITLPIFQWIARRRDSHRPGKSE
ncbi:hypothetical protein F5887DRAFT_932635 [Amanita rubescens]|nr:hypothetical protein F5887DRAFT_932635 [Amanita rubescens]